MHGDRNRQTPPSSPDGPNFAPLPASPSSAPAAPIRIKGLLFLTVILVVGFLCASFLFRPDPRDSHAQNPAGEQTPPSPYFRNWAKPDLALVLTGETWAYLQPCGCSDPQYGGLVRRYEFIKSLRDKGWPVLAVDLGDVAAEKSGPQTMLKYETMMKALHLMGYAAVGLGKNEMFMPLVDAIGQYALNHAEPAVLAANLVNPAKDPLLEPIKPWYIADKTSPRVGVLGLVGPSVVESVKNIDKAKFADNSIVLPRALAEFADKKVELVVMLYQGTEAEAAKCAAYCAKLHQLNNKLPRVHLMMCHSPEEEPPGKMDRVGGPKENTGDTYLVRIGHKGRKVGVVGVFKQANGSLDLKYDLIHLGPEWQQSLLARKNPHAANPVLALMENYAKRLQREDYLAKFPRSEHPVQAFAATTLKLEAKYIGSEACGNCHAHAYKVWHDSKHAKAYKALTETAKYPSLRQFDGECVVCHTVGFQHNTGFYDKSNSAKLNQKLHHVSCESCHGPGSVHANNPNNPQLNALMNPFKPSQQELNPQVPMPQREALFRKRMLNIDMQCMKCHDQDNDVHWIKHDFLEKWMGHNGSKPIIHVTPPLEAKQLGIKQFGERLESLQFQKMLEKKRH